MSDLSKILAEDEREMLKLIAPSVKNASNPHDLGGSDSENDNPCQTYINSH